MELNLQEIRDAIAHHTALGKEINTLKSSISGLREPYRPAVHMRPTNFQPLADFLHMDVEEINVILNHAVQNPNDLTRKALEHLILVGKIQCSEELNTVRQHRKELNDQYEAQMAKYHAGMARLDSTKEKIKELQAVPRVQLNAIWQPIVDQLQAECEQHGHRMYLMDSKTQEYLNVLVRNSKYVNQGSVGEIAVDWDLVRKFKPEHIRVVLEGILRVYDNNSTFTVPPSAVDLAPAV